MGKSWHWPICIFEEEALMGFLNRVFGRREPTSRDIAKERLQLVLVHDRIKISPVMLEKMKDELITVISRYVEIDADGVQVTFTQGRRESRLVADIPVVGPAKRTSKKAAAGAGAGAGGNG
jgi:cell division topological specificity factor